jgi:hypothetical protein
MFGLVAGNNGVGSVVASISGNTVTFTPSGVVHPNDLIVVSFNLHQAAGANTAAAFTDNVNGGTPWNNTIQQEGTANNNYAFMGWAQVPLGAPAGDFTVTCTLSSLNSSPTGLIGYDEFSVAPGAVVVLAASESNDNSGATTESPTTGALTWSGNALLYGSLKFFTGISTSAGAGFTQSYSASGTSNQMNNEYWLNNGSGSQQINWTATTAEIPIVGGLVFIEKMPSPGMLLPGM